MTEAQSMVCYSRGVMDSLIDKLTGAMETHPRVEPLLKDLESLREDLVNKFAGGQATHWQVKLWMKQNRQLVYDIEDWIDLLVAKLDESEPGFEEQIDEFKAKIDAARSRSKRYDLLDKVPTSSDADHQDAAPSKVAVDSRLLWEKKGVLVGINGPRKTLEEHLKDTQKKRKVVSVLGMGGLGKTTLATEVYEELNGQFDCHASVTVGRNSSTAALMDVFRQVNPEMVGHGSRASLNKQEVQEVIHLLWEFLKNKRYFIFIDDIRSTNDWSVINCALPNNDLESRILTTTRVKDVAMSCSVRPADFIYEMKVLDEDDSRTLLLSTIPVQPHDGSASFGKYCDNVLNKCCGLPLAIIVTAGLLATKRAYLGPLEKSEESGGMRNVLDICFADLAPPVKACFLDLSIFPENYTIKKDRLIRRWVAEGFIPEIDQESMLETGERYFNELICRKLIRPVCDDYNDDQAVLCTVHPVIHDFIASLSRQEDFHTTAAELISGPFPYGTIRRFSVDCRRQENNEADTLISSAVHLSRMRSLTVFGDAGMPHLWTFKHLRVLDLEDTKTFYDKQLENIGSLFLLRYLGLGGTNVTKLPQQMMELKHLSTLDLRRTSVMELPAVWNTELVSVLADGLMIPRGIMEMERLQELSTVSLLPDDAARLVQKSRQLRMLGVTFGYIYILTKANQQGVTRFLEEVGKSNLHSLVLDDYPSDSVKLFKCWANEGPKNLRKFELRMSDCLQVVPPKMEFLRTLTHLHIRVREVEAQGVNALGSLPNLVLLKLFSGEGTRERLTISSQHGFRCLKVFWFRSYFLGMGLQFEAGAMPQLQRLQMEFNARKTKFAEYSFNFGIQHLCCLLQVCAIILCKHATDSEAKAAEAAIRYQVSRIPYNPLPVHDGDLRRKEAAREADSSSSTPSVDIRISILPESSSHLPLPGLISFVMVDAMVTSSTGAMNSVLTKLETLTEERYAELTGTDEQELTMLRDELRVMNSLLKQLSDTPLMRVSRNQMRELTYNIEDSIDDLLSVNEKGSGGSTEKARVMPHDFIEQIQKLNAQVEMADLGSTVRRTEKRTFGPRYMPREQWLSKVYNEDNRLVGMDGPRDELVKRLIDDEQGELQGVCISGLCGIGKSTLAAKVCNQIQNRFHHSVFLSVDQETDISDNDRKTRLCRSIRSQVEMGHQYYNTGYSIIDQVKACLKFKRLVIVIDGVSSDQMLEDIKVLLPQNSVGSRIITITHMEPVAESSTFIYTMKPLTSLESLSLFQGIVFGPGRSCPSALQEVHEQIVEACHGIPLALTVIAGLLASKPAEMAHWGAVEKEVKQVEEDHPIWLRKIFDICYSDLPPDMKTCLLYLSSFPANHVVRKDRLIRRWAAEGFLPKRSVETLWETGEAYFFELIARKLIQPVYDDEKDVLLPTGCKIGDSIHDFITSLSSEEENFVKSGQQGVFWRIYPSYEKNDEPGIALFKEQKSSKVRSLTVEGGCLPDLSAFKHVRVLDLQDVRYLLEDLRSVGRLSLLRYLGLAATHVEFVTQEIVALPQEILALEHLETVDLRRTKLEELPAFKSTKLVSLSADNITLPFNLGEMHVLEELSTVRVGDDVHRLAKVVNHSKRLRRLGVIIAYYETLSAEQRNGLMDLLGAIGNSNIQSLCLNDRSGCLLDLLVDRWAQQRPRHLQKIELRIDSRLPEVPRNMSPSLIDLTHLSIIVDRVDTEGLCILGILPNLVFLSLEPQDMTERSIISKNGFRCLRVFWCWCTYSSGRMGLQFEAGAMPQLRRLRLEFNAKETESKFGGVDFGIQFLTCLVQVHATIDCYGSTAASVEAVEATMRDHVSQNRNNPVLEITRKHEGLMAPGREDKIPFLFQMESGWQVPNVTVLKLSRKKEEKRLSSENKDTPSPDKPRLQLSRDDVDLEDKV